MQYSTLMQPVTLIFRLGYPKLMFQLIYLEIKPNLMHGSQAQLLVKNSYYYYLIILFQMLKRVRSKYLIIVINIDVDYSTCIAL